MNSLTLSSHMLLRYSAEPARIRNNPKTQINIVYSNVITPNNVLGNLTATRADHLP